MDARRGWSTKTLKWSSTPVAFVSTGSAA
jgi:hypothetical protein